MEDRDALKRQEGGLEILLSSQVPSLSTAVLLSSVSGACGLPTSPFNTAQSYYLSRVGIPLMALLLLAHSLQGSGHELNKGVGGHFLRWAQSLTQNVLMAPK